MLSVMWNVSLAMIRRSEKIFLSALKWLRFGSNRGSRPDIGKQREREREMKRGRENDDVRGKDYDTERRLFEGNGYRDLFDACTVEISIDSQLGRIPSVVSAPIPHLRPLTLPPHPPIALLLPPPPIPFAARSPSALCSPISRPKWFLIWRYPCPAHPTSDLLLSSSFTFLCLYTPCFFSIIFGDARLGKRGSRLLRNSRNEYQINESTSVNFNFLHLPAELYLAF